LGPDVNESYLNFTVNKNGEIRFGLMAVKGVGEAAADAIIKERDEHGIYNSIFEFVKRVNLRTVNKSTFESLAQAGGFDSFEGMHRAQFFAQDSNEEATFIEKLIRFGNTYQANESSSQQSLFGDIGHVEIPNPKIPFCETWSNLEKLKREKSVAGFFITGHPLDDYREEIEAFCNISIKKAKENIYNAGAREFVFAGIVSKVRHETAKNGNAYGRFTVEDFEDQVDFALFGEDYLKLKHLLEEDKSLLIKCKAQSRYGKADMVELKVTSMSLLSESMDKLAKQLHVQIPISSMSDLLVKEMVKIIKAHKGDCRIRISFVDLDENYKVDMHTGKHKIQCSVVLRELRKLGGMALKVIS
jgi:DNA polymerase III subunit alpha